MLADIQRFFVGGTQTVTERLCVFKDDISPVCFIQHLNVATTSHAAVLQLHAELLILVLDQHVLRFVVFVFPVLLLGVWHLLGPSCGIRIEVGGLSVVVVLV